MKRKRDPSDEEYNVIASQKSVGSCVSEESHDPHLAEVMVQVAFGAKPLAPVSSSRVDTGPMWVIPPEAGSVVKLAVLLVEAFGPAGAAAVRFCSECAEPLERCRHMHTYVVTRPSLHRYPGGVHAAVEQIRKFSRGFVPQEVLAALVSEASRPSGVTVLLGTTCVVQSGSLSELLCLYGAETVTGCSDIMWRPANDERVVHSEARPAFWNDIDSWQESKIERGRDKEAVVEEATPTKDNTLLLDYSSGSEFSFEEPREGRVSGSPKGVGSILDEEDVSCAVVVLGAVLGALLSYGGYYYFSCSEEAAVQVRHTARSLGIKCWQEWDLRELGMESAAPTYCGPAPLFLPRTPRWTLLSVRPHQEAALNAVFPSYVDGARVRSGIVALPCGAGKTMVGVLASAAVRAPSLVLCTSGIAVEQWIAQYGRWADLHTSTGRVVRYTGKVKEKVTDATQVVVTTYNMLMPRKRSAEGALAVSSLLTRHWGMVVLDEVHVLPAESCSTVIKNLRARSFLGLTATLVREDNKIETLDHLIGPRLHEAEWADLVKVGVLARVKCIEVRCVMTREFTGEYMKAEKNSLKELLACLNPSKLQATAEIVRHHERRGDKILVFSDSLYVLRELSKLLQRRAISGATGLRERLQLLSDFQSGTRLNTLIVSRIGDCAIDLPAASVIIQVSSHFGSRRQEAQRLGRILRPKGSLIHAAPFLKEPPTPFNEMPNALFYTMVTQDTAEVVYSHRRQEFLEEQV